MMKPKICCLSFEGQDKDLQSSSTIGLWDAGIPDMRHIYGIIVVKQRDKPRENGKVSHINQLRMWDCGLACVLMVLRTLCITAIFRNWGSCALRQDSSETYD
ncbi:Protein GUCD1 [Forsythia ovata]|uniref:Protein GUCD1 n=1 Tax=Forsythia ovata TaxID=205694 RepID=A0ABD1W2E9_9LAMI